MPWFKVDDTLAAHPKVRSAGLPAMGLWVVCGAYAAQYLTEGKVPEWFVLTWPQGRKLARELVTAGLWYATDDGWHFHQWDERQLSKEAVEAERAAARERQHRWREKRRLSRDKSVSNGVNNGVTDAVTDGVSNAPPFPPQPFPSSPTQVNVSSRPRKRGTRLDDDWKPDPDDIEWQRSNGIDDFLARRELPKFINYWTSKTGDATKLDWSKTWRNWLLTAQERQPRAAVNDSPRRPNGWEFGMGD